MFSFLSKPFWDVISSKHDALVMYTISSSGLSLLKHKDCQCSADALLISALCHFQPWCFWVQQHYLRSHVAEVSAYRVSGKCFPALALLVVTRPPVDWGAVQRLIYSANSCNSVRTLAVAFANILDLGLHATTGDESPKIADIYTALCNLVSQPLLVGALPNQRTRLRTVWASLTSNFCIFLCCQGEACF